MKEKLLLNHKLRAALLMLFLCALPLSGHCELIKITQDHFMYEINTDTGEATALGPEDKKQIQNDISLGLKEKVTYMSKDYPVTAIGQKAFMYCDGFTGALVIPGSVTSIGENAFRDCSGLTGELVIPESVTTIGEDAFHGCERFTGELVIPKSVTVINYSAFSGCKGFTSLVIPESVTTIGEDAFRDCSGLTGGLVIPESVTKIGIHAFSDCSGFTGELVIPESVTTIEYGAFRYCSGFTSLVIPESVTTIEYGAFENCSGFTGELVIPESVTKIGRHAFSYCSGFTGELVIPESVTTIEYETFNGCKGFTSLVIPESVTAIEFGAFRLCSGFTGKLVIPESVTTIDGEAFQHCSGFTGKLVIPESVTTIGSRAFYSCSFTGELVIPESVTTIGGYAFAFCDGFTGELVIPKSVTYIGSNAFLWCDGFTKTTCYATVPPRIPADEQAFSSTPAYDNPLYVPAASIELYKEANDWKDFTDIRAIGAEQITGISLDKSEVSVDAGKSVTLVADVQPADAPDRSVVWTSSDSSIATVVDGVVTGVKVGTVTITAKAINDMTATCTVTVNQAAETISLDSEEEELTMGETVQLTAEVGPETTTDKSVAWSSDKPEVATVDANGLVKAIGVGEAVITATTVNGLEAKCTVTVTAPLATSIALDRTSLSGKIGEEYTLTATVLPAEASSQKLTWTSSDEKIAAVTENGTVRILAEGTAVITVSTTDGSDLEAECTVIGVSGIIATIMEAGTPVNIYNVGGMLVKRNATSEDYLNLASGIYIINGEKIIKR